MKRYLSILTAIVMLLALCVSAFAAPAPAVTGTITIRNATPGKVYRAYKVFDATFSNDSVSYSFTLTDGNQALFEALMAQDSPFALTPSTTANVYNVELKDGFTTAQISEWLTAHEDLLPAPVEKTAGEGESTVEFTDMPFGYYFITSSLGSVVTIDSNIPNVTVIDKNEKPGWHDPDPDDPGPEGKAIVIENEDGSLTYTDVNSANFGDTVHFYIGVDATAYDGTDLVTYYYITDTLGAGFGPANDIVVSIDGTTLTEGEDYVIYRDGNTFEIHIPFGEKYGSNAVITVEYSAVVLDTAVIAGEGNLNTANFSYDTKPIDPDDPEFPPEDPDDPTYPPDPHDPENPVPYDEENEVTTTTYVYAIGILKVDQEGNPLTGAKFSVTDADGSVIYAVPTDTAGVYNYCAADAEGAVSEFEVGADGVLIIKGLAAGSYVITETAAPAGYNLLADTVTVTAQISETTTYTTTITVYYDAEGNVVSQEESVSSETVTVPTNVVPLVVVNNAGSELPSTGGIGTKIFYVIGGALMLTAIVLIITRRKIRASRD
ncbi:MAG: isopeptide-forming domain-containing fimbrial protein [Clostridia bacterium]|nr:isopeptide-forming domain-containing fimbrial protein [Clostridia bacterium]